MRQCSRHVINGISPPHRSQRASDHHLHLSILHRPQWSRYIDCTSSRLGSISRSALLSTGLSSHQKRNTTFSWLRDWGSRISTSTATAQTRCAHSSSSNKWLSRQSNDRFTREARLLDLKSRAAFKLLQINEKYRILAPGMTVVDLGFAPGSWSQVAIDLVRPGIGRVVGVDVIPVQPPKGVSGIQGDFLSPEVQARVRDFLQDEGKGRLRQTMPVDEVQDEETSYMDRGQMSTPDGVEHACAGGPVDSKTSHSDKCVDVVLSDMSAPWELTSGLWKNSISNPYRRMMNTTGNKFRDHAGSMDLCRSALYFSHATLKVGGHFVCKFYQGAEDRIFERQLRAMFTKVHREKPESSRSESREAFFVGIKRLANVDRDKVFDEG